MSENKPLKIIKNLKSVGKATCYFRTSDGSGILILPYGGRILGLYSPQRRENFFWTNPVLESVPSAKPYYAGDEWHNSGGDRTWLAPEIYFCYPEFPDMSVYKHQKQLEPGNYKITKSTNAVQLVNNFRVTCYKSKKEIQLKITKLIKSATNPLRYENHCKTFKDVEYAGYTLDTQLEILNKNIVSDSLGIWNLLQLPYGGCFFIPTYGKAEPKIYFGKITSKQLKIEDHLINFQPSGEGVKKIGIGAAACTGRIGYLSHKESRYSLIIRNFNVNPSGEYVDVPLTEINRLKYAAQLCSVNGVWGCFNELEYHVPAIGGNNAAVCSRDSSQIWAFRGNFKTITQIANKLLT